MYLKNLPVDSRTCWSALQSTVISLIVFIAVSCSLDDGTFINTWKKAAVSSDALNARTGHSSVVFDEKMWVIGGYTYGEVFKDVKYSTDGSNWNVATEDAAFGEIYGHSTVVFDDKMWIIGGWNGTENRQDVWFSSDGTSWSLATEEAAFPGRVGHKSVVFKDKMWVMGGRVRNDGKSLGDFFGDVWFSTDGVNWSMATESADFGERSEHALVVYDNKMWIIGGVGPGVWYNDAWYSEDGSNWTKTTNTVLDDPMQDHIVIVFDDSLYLVSPVSESFSSDGVEWTSVVQRVPSRSIYNYTFGMKDDFTGLAYKGKMWVIAGIDDQLRTQDVFYSPGPS